MKSAFIATCPDSDEATIVVLGVTTLDEFRAAAAAQGLIRTCDDEEGYEFCKPLQAFAVVKPEGVWDLGASADTPGALPAMVATARWVDFTSCQCEGCPVHEGTHKPAQAVHQIAEPAASVEKQMEEVIGCVRKIAILREGGYAHDAKHEIETLEFDLRTLLSSAQSVEQAAPQAVQASVPTGWKLVPDADNMTDDQAEAIAEVARVCGGGAYGIYRAALDAAPHPPEAAQSMQPKHATQACNLACNPDPAPKEKQFANAHPAEGVPAKAVKPGDALIEAVDKWFADNTGLGGCSDKDVAELAAIFAATQPAAQGMEAEYQRGYQDGYNRRYAEVKGALV